MSNKAQNPNDKKFDLAERTAKFGEDVIEFAQSLEQNFVNRPIISQFVDAGTSIGANYMEADGAESRKDFEHKIGISRKESKESLHWLRMIAKANPQRAQDARILWKEAQEPALIFSSIINRSRVRKR